MSLRKIRYSQNNISDHIYENVMERKKHIRSQSMYKGGQEIMGLLFFTGKIYSQIWYIILLAAS